MLQGPGGRQIEDITAQSAAQANKEQIKQKASERVQQEIGSAVIQSQSVTIQTDLDQAISEAITMSDIYTNYEKAKVDLQVMEQKAQSIESQLNQTDADILKIQAELESIQTQKGMAGAAFDGVAGLIGGMIGNKLLGGMGNMFKSGFNMLKGLFPGAKPPVPTTTPKPSGPKPSGPSGPKPEGPLTKSGKPDMRYKANKVPTPSTPPPTAPSSGGGWWSKVTSKVSNVASKAWSGAKGIVSTAGAKISSVMPKMPSISGFFKGPIAKGIGKALGPILSLLSGAIDIYSITSQARADQAAGKKPDTGKIGKQLFTSGAATIARLGLNLIPGVGTALSLADSALGYFGVSPIDWLAKNLIGLIPDSAFSGLGELALGDTKPVTTTAAGAVSTAVPKTPAPVAPKTPAPVAPKTPAPVTPKVTTPTIKAPTPTAPKVGSVAANVAKAGTTAKVAAGTTAAVTAAGVASVAKTAQETKATAESTKAAVKSVVAKIESTKKEQKEKEATVVKELQTLNASTQTMVKLTRVLTTLAAATFENKTDVTLKLDGKQITYAVDKTKLNGKGMSNNTYGFGM
jgi:hypothetical protein